MGDLTMFSFKYSKLEHNFLFKCLATAMIIVNKLYYDLYQFAQVSKGFFALNDT